MRSKPSGEVRDQAQVLGFVVDDQQVVPFGSPGNGIAMRPRYSSNSAISPPRRGVAPSRRRGERRGAERPLVPATAPSAPPAPACPGAPARATLRARLSWGQRAESVVARPEREHRYPHGHGATANAGCARSRRSGRWSGTACAGTQRTYPDPPRHVEICVLAEAATAEPSRGRAWTGWQLRAAGPGYAQVHQRSVRRRSRD